jgi:hypothetical protein
MTEARVPPAAGRPAAPAVIGAIDAERDRVLARLMDGGDFVHRTARAAVPGAVIPRAVVAPALEAAELNACALILRILSGARKGRDQQYAEHEDGGP